MTTWAGVPRNIAVTAVITLTFVSLASTATADPASPSNSDPAQLAFINFPFNGIVLLVLFALFTFVNRTKTPMGWVYYSLLVVMSSLIITFTGAVIDVVVFDVDSLAGYVVGLSAIAIICTLVGHLALRMDGLWSTLTGAVFFTVNAVAWYAYPGIVKDPEYFITPSVWGLVSLFFLVAILVMSHQLFGRGTVLSFETRTNVAEEDREVIESIGDMERHFSIVLLVVVITSFFLAIP
jgi:hypothetical protein